MLSVSVGNFTDVAGILSALSLYQPLKVCPPNIGSGKSAFSPGVPFKSDIAAPPFVSSLIDEFTERVILSVKTLPPDEVRVK